MGNSGVASFPPNSVRGTCLEHDCEQVIGSGPCLFLLGDTGTEDRTAEAEIKSAAPPSGELSGVVWTQYWNVEGCAGAEYGNLPEGGRRTSHTPLGHSQRLGYINYSTSPRGEILRSHYKS